MQRYINSMGFTVLSVYNVCHVIERAGTRYERDPVPDRLQIKAGYPQT